MEYDYSMPDSPSSDILVIDTDICENINDDSSIPDINIPGTTTHPLPGFSTFQEPATSSPSVSSTLCTGNTIYPSSSWEQESQSSWDMYLMKDKSKGENVSSGASCASGFNESGVFNAQPSADVIKDKAKEKENVMSSEGMCDYRYVFNVINAQHSANVMKDKANSHEISFRSSEAMSSNNYVDNVFNHPGQALLAGTTLCFAPSKSNVSTELSQGVPGNGNDINDDDKQINANHNDKKVNNGDSSSQNPGEQVNNVEHSFLMDKILGLSQSVSDIPSKESAKESTTKGDKKNVESKKAKPDKPPYTYVSMIAVAIMHSSKGHLSLPAIREKLKTFFPFFNGEYDGWKNSVRHALSNSKCFYKVKHIDDHDRSTNNVWKIKYSFLKPATFRRIDTACMAHLYKDTLQEQLGLPPFVPCSTDILLPPKPTQYNNYGMKLLTVPQEDFLNARNESVPTPLSVISEKDSTIACSNVSVNPVSSLCGRKRKREEFESDATSESQCSMSVYNDVNQQPVYNVYNPYQNIQKPQINMIGQQWSHDYGYYRYQENQPIITQEIGFYPQPYNQLLGYEHYYRQMILNQCFAEHNYGYPGYANNVRPTDSATALDLTSMNETDKGDNLK
ncbi:hypothetical protein ACF0H5_020426 [Mactra antiquata]